MDVRRSDLPPDLEFRSAFDLDQPYDVTPVSSLRLSLRERRIQNVRVTRHNKGHDLEMNSHNLHFRQLSTTSCVSKSISPKFATKLNPYLRRFSVNVTLTYIILT